MPSNDRKRIRGGGREDFNWAEEVRELGRGVGGLAGTTDGVRDSGRGETNDELRLGSTRGKMPKVKTHSVLAVVKGYERGNKVFGERFMNSIRSDCQDAIANNFLGVGVEVAGYTLTCISGKNSDLNPSFGGFRKVISCSEERPNWQRLHVAEWKREVRVLEFKIHGCSEVRLQTSIQSKVIGILWKVGGNRRRRGGNGSCCPAASGTSGWLLFELELLDCHNTYELTLIRIR